ncbi:hypothetical protein B7P43_G11424 [Cryptotermes secundus]|uniref:Uncharacterized protein n=1 Tax=Cryptotermes secundus TaxID=105785 RepID=A0A2J7QYP1_9NEOP|nr:hypothetical protein B7P43_G11424 [Cryptotermes secundus]
MIKEAQMSKKRAMLLYLLVYKTPNDFRRECAHYILQILEKKWEYNESVHRLFIDFKKACDSIRREVLCNTVRVWDIHETSYAD